MRLDGVRVLDLTRLLPGPYATALLADRGADVIKVEDTGAGDYARWMPPTTDDGVGALFDAVNRDKRSVALDLKDDAHREAFDALVADADVLVESFRPGVVDRLGVDYETLREVNPGLVYCSLSGYGQTGPYRERVGHDLNYVGLAGLLDMTRATEDEKPRIPGYPIADMTGGLSAAFAVVSGLFSRELGDGTGSYVDVSMTDAVCSLSQAVTAGVGADPESDPRPGETFLTGALPWYDVYETADGRWVTYAALEPHFHAAFCEAVDRPDLADAQDTDDTDERAALRVELADVFAGRPQEAWAAFAREHPDVPVEPVLTPREALDHDQLRTREVVREEDGRPRVGSPVQVPEEPSDVPGPAPGHGEHTAEVLSEAGLDAETVERIAGDGE